MLSKSATPASFFSHLECGVPCGAGPFDPRQEHHVCTCGAPLLARYDLTAAKRWPKTSLPGRDSTMWRYAEILPLLESDKGVDIPVTLGEGWTPLVRARRLGKALGLERLFIKDESINPTSSAKARGLATAMTRALHLGTRAAALAAAGHAATAFSAYAAKAGIEARVFLPKDAKPLFARECEFFGARVTAVDGLFPAVSAAADEQIKANGWYDMTAFHEPYRIEGEKTIAYEVAEQLGWQVPDWIVCPTAGGTTIIGVWKAFAEMASLGWIDPVRRPHLVAVQAAGCAPFVRALASNAEKASPWENAHTIADGLRVPETPADFLVLRALRESSGTAVPVGDAEMLSGMRDLARTEGVSASPEGGAALHALRVLTAEGRVKPHDTVIVFSTAAAGKYYDLVTQPS